MKETRKRHGCLTAWLVLLIIMNSITVLTYLIYFFGSGIFIQVLQNQELQSQLPQSQMLQIQMLLNTPIWVFIVLIALALFNVVCAAALFMWKKWGFWGFCATSASALAVNLIYFRSGTVSIIISIISGLLAVLILFGVLHIGRENKGWPQLK
jgi:hypothetical protein